MRRAGILSCADGAIADGDPAERGPDAERGGNDELAGADDLVHPEGDVVDMRLGEIRLAEPGEFLAGVPAILGFVPVRSLVVAVLRAAPRDPDSALIDVVARFDLTPSPAGDGSRTLAATVAEVCDQQGVVGVLASVIDDRRSEPEPGTAGRDSVVTALAAQLELRSIPLCGAWAVQAIAPGYGWWSVLGADRRGVLPDPAASPITLSHVLDGKQIRRSRSELIAAVSVDLAMREQVCAEMGPALARAHQRFADAAGGGDRIGYSRRAAQYLLWQIANVESGVRMSAAELAESAAALRDKHARDAMFALAGTDHAGAAEQLWAMMTRGLPDTDRAEAATLLGYCAYARGDGPFAGIAFAAALDADPEHPLAALLDAALTSGMDPQRLQRLITCGREAAIDLGIDLDLDRSW
ncbi:DUF4192 domain-containing protein [Nocardia cyriacigeorgica]|uniref:DUF4192 domain-containing protein n=1 Tax=Nocardia cyriacigeorgica TaxID=135487 RepID=UPI00138ADD2F|nr:DUF4192 domain-containing protein [Nocardia cyriacigeorgica]MBF6495587.1 DUF4192 domain-containing protein [Nocardia cyriacigeorgica]